MWSSESSDEEEAVVLRRPRIYRPRIEYGHMEESYEYNERFRLTAQKLEHLLNLLGFHLERPTERNHALPAKLQLQVALHWMGTGAQYHAIADMHGVCKASVCRAVHSVVTAVNNTMSAIYVKWPDNMQGVVEQFFAIRGMPMVCGCLDGTLIKIDAPSEHEDVFVDRHGNHSVNCMVVCGPDLTFYYSYANWPGSTHDSRVLRNSGLFNRFENGWRPIPNGLLLGDSAYPLKDWLIPPVVVNNDEANRRFLRAHKSTRRLIENAIGTLKEKFPCLNYLRLKPYVACEVFNCCVTLCNFSRLPGDDILNGVDNDDIDPEDENLQLRPDAEQQIGDERGENRLQRILNYFRN